MQWATILSCLRLGRPAVALLLAAAVLLHGPRPGRASMVDVYGWGARAVSMGGAFTALADDFTAVYYNPAGLMYQRTLEETVPHRKGIKFDFGYVYGDPQLYVRDPQKGRHSEDYGSTTGPYLGVTLDPIDFHGTFARKLFAFGLGLYMPVDHILYYGRYFPEERRFPFFYDYSMRFVLLPGMAVEPWPGLSIGVGLQFLIRLHTDTVGTVYASLDKLTSPDAIFHGRVPLERENVRLGEFEDLTLNLAPIVGLQYRPFERLRFGLVYRGENYVNDFGLTDPLINLGEILAFEQGYQFKFVRFFTPHQFFLGVAFLPTSAITISLDAGWFDWSDFHDIEASKPDPPFRDTWMPRIGVEYRWQEVWSFRAGYFFYDSPVPEQKGFTNFMDNDRHVGSSGIEWIWTDPPGFWDKPVHFSLSLQYHALVERTYRKTDPDDPYYPGYSFGGYIWMGGLQVSVPL
ncbi:MAG: outer membrane protein transport protein [bacterium]